MIVRRVHSLQVGHMTQVQAVWSAQRRDTTLRQPAGTSMGDYKAAFDLALDNMRALGVNPMPTDLEQARHFLMGLISCSMESLLAWC